MTLSAKWSLACLLTVAVLAGCGDDDGAAGTAGTGMSGTGAVGGDNDSGVAATGGTGGTGDVDGGESGTGGVGATGGTGGVGATGGTGGAGGTGGTGGATACATNCSDGVDCTVDSCEDGTCVHVIDVTACTDGESCHPTRGCESGVACSGGSPCPTTDACQANITCNTTSASCEWEPLDGDADGQSPVVCGGDDCDDSNQDIHPGAVDTCNGDDDDCDGTTDESAECEDGESCVAGECICPEGKNVCGSQCVNRQTSRDHCGTCNNSCGEAGLCVDGDCSCPSPGAICATGIFTDNCVDTDSSHDNCGGCGNSCANLEICDDGVCTACGGMGEPCCGSSANGLSSDGCPGADLLCVGLRGQPLSRCTCPSDHLLCDNACIDPQTNNDNCGSCGDSCAGGLVGLGSETCIAGACTECGQEVGQPCCEVGSLIGGPMLDCGGANLLLSCNQDTKLCRLGLF